MSERINEDTDAQELFERLPYVWESQGPQGRLTGLQAMEELLYRFDLLDYVVEFDEVDADDWWDVDDAVRQDILADISTEQAMVRLQREADDRGYEVDLGL